METVSLGNFVLPLAVNGYTGGMADWLSRTLAAVGFGHDATMVFHWFLGGIFIVLVHRFLRIHGTGIAASAAALILASDWVFIFFRRALGGTEVLLHAAVLLCLWALWSRRWAGGRHGLTALALGVGIGLSAKLTFVLSIVPLALTAWLLRWDKPRLRPPLPDRWAPILLALILPITPLLVMWIHHFGADLPALETHDHIHVQLERVWSNLSGGPQPAPDTTSSLFAWLGNASSFLSIRWQADAPPALSPLRWVGWVLVVVGSILAWRDRDDTPRIALTRFCSVFLVLQVTAIWLVAQDMHHLAIATPTMAILAGLSIELIAARFTPPRSLVRGVWVAIGCMPWVWVGSYAITQTDEVLHTIPRPTIDRSGQDALVDMLQDNDVQRVLTVDYDSAGSLDVLMSDVDFIHGWTTVVQRRSTALPELLNAVLGHHVLVINHVPPSSHNISPQESDLDAAGAQAGAELEVVDRLPGDDAVLYAVGSRMGRP
jgi:4-amino-4-deoxy-L-arabinose transferase-like glycosyltransferase